ncbi:MAG: hypothetical protein DRQ39_05865 [Gammaproteobacteria bacterium]|nr:MAG: hypothetical protein DRQ39_05865 [Gammaproteobacteria bacterium]
MRRKLPSELSKKNLIRDNSNMLSRLHAYKDIMESQLMANIELEIKITKLEKEIAKLRGE